jgi:recombinational DNA repair protein (RecF pathway)
MHHIHLTKAFVLSSFPFGEAGKILNLLTKEFGVIRVNAQATRKANSKLKQSIQDFSLTEVALVFGKKGWILTNARIDKNIFYQIKNSDNNQEAEIKNSTIKRIFSLLERMVPFEHDEEQGSFFFDLIEKNIELIAQNSSKETELIEICTIYQIMNFLGYVDPQNVDSLKVENDLSYVEKNKNKIVGIINNAIKESHL